MGEPTTPSIQPRSIQPRPIQPLSIQPEDGDTSVLKTDLPPTLPSPTTPTTVPSSLIKYYHLGRELLPGVESFDAPGTYTLLAVFEPSETRARSSPGTRASTGTRASPGTRASTGARASTGTRASSCYLGSSVEVTLVVVPPEEGEEDRYRTSDSHHIHKPCQYTSSSPIHHPANTPSLILCVTPPSPSSTTPIPTSYIFCLHPLVCTPVPLPPYLYPLTSTPLPLPPNLYPLTSTPYLHRAEPVLIWPQPLPLHYGRPVGRAVLDAVTGGWVGLTDTSYPNYPN